MWNCIEVKYAFLELYQNLIIENILQNFSEGYIIKSHVEGKFGHEIENICFFQCKIKFYFTHEHQNLYFHSWLPPLLKILLLMLNCIEKI